MMPWQMQTAGRNDPCPCGSGKKFKKCCIEKASEIHSQWAQQRGASESLVGDMMQFSAREFGLDIDVALQDFLLTDLPIEWEPDENEDRIFMPYFLFHWDPQRPRSGKGALRRGGEVSRRYEIERGSELPELERKLLEQAKTQPMSFFEVLSSRPNEGMSLRDSLIGREFIVAERLGSRTTRHGDILYGQIWEVDGLCTMGCMAPICIPPNCKADVIGLHGRLRKKIAKQNRPLDADDLFRFADLVRLTYLEIHDRLSKPPEFQNTDGDPLEFHTVKFRIDSAGKAFEALAGLAAGRSKDELLSGAELDASRELRSVQFDWLKRGNKRFSTWENTILGTIKITEKFVECEVNSEKRARKVLAEVERRLGGEAVFLSDDKKTLEQALKEYGEARKKPPKAEPQPAARLLQDPEVRKHFTEHIQRQVDAWAYERLPILKGLTPIQAVADAEGREIVESLLIEWERRASDAPGTFDVRPDFSNLRRTLNLPASSD